jgi:acyl-ACP thioesterase
MDRIVPQKYTAEFTPSVMEQDFKKRFKPSFLLNCFQFIAGEHATLLNAGFENMRDAFNALWVVSRIYVEIYENAPSAEPLRFETWPLAPGSAYCIRNYSVTTRGGKPIAVGKSMWLVLDFHTHKLRPIKTIDLFSPPDYMPDHLPDSTLGKIILPENKQAVYEMPIRYPDIDVNLHVNNAKYADYMLGALTCGELSEREVATFQINFNREAHENDKILICRAVDGEKILIEGAKNAENCFSAFVTLK